MNTITKDISIKAILIVGLCATGTLFANFVEIEYVGMGAKSGARIWGGGHEAFNTSAGAFKLEKHDGSGLGDIWADDVIYAAFCVDLEQYVPSGKKTYEVLDVAEGPRPIGILGEAMGTVKADFIAELWAAHFDHSWIEGGYTSQQKSQAEAFQVAMWEIIYEDIPDSPLGWDVSTDGTAGARGFKATKLETNLANTWLHALTGNGPKAELALWSNACKQDFVVQVPEPATIMLMGLGVSLITLKRKKRCAHAYAKRS